MRRKEKGLCFGGNEKFTQGHKCQTPKIFFIDNVNNTNTNNTVEEETDSDHEETYELVKLENYSHGEHENFLHVFMGWSTPHTMRVAARIRSVEVVVLIDKGSTYNFINDKVAKLLRLPVIRTKIFSVKIANGGKL